MAKADFDLEKAKSGATLFTRDRRSALNFHENNDVSGSAFRYTATIDGANMLFTAEGRYHADGRESHNDLFLFVEVQGQKNHRPKVPQSNLPHVIKTAEAQADANLDKLLRQLRTSGAPQSARNIIIKKIIKSLLNEL